MFWNQKTGNCCGKAAFPVFRKGRDMPVKALYQGGSGEIVEKKSRFIATFETIESEEEALAFIGRMKKQYWDARHNCYAFVAGENQNLQRCSDDGEPAGTAGRPMLDVLLKEGIHNAAVVVTRYFGGVLLGTGGLVRAYTQAMHAGLDACPVVTMCYGTELRLVTDYNGIGKIQYILGQRGLEIKEPEYTDMVSMKLTVPYEDCQGLCKELTEATAGRVKIEELEKKYFAK